jgi:hypothetical protein
LEIFRQSVGMHASMVKDRMNFPFGDVKCISTLKSIAPSYWTNAIDRSYQTDSATAFLTPGDPASDAR